MLEYFSSFTWININELEYLACLVSEFQSMWMKNIILFYFNFIFSSTGRKVF